MNTRNNMFLRYLRLARLLLCVVMLTAAIGAMPQPAKAEGVISHNYIVKLAIENMKARAKDLPANSSEILALINEYPDVVDYGAMFPDMPMLMKYMNLTIGGQTYDDIAEVIHDTYYINNVPDKLPKFRESLMAYMAPAFLADLKGEDRKQARKSVAFLLGVIAHQAADTPFHFGPGNIQVHYEQDHQVSHFSLELGMDMIVQKAANPKTNMLFWDVPKIAVRKAMENAPYFKGVVPTESVSPTNPYDLSHPYLYTMSDLVMDLGITGQRAMYGAEWTASGASDPLSSLKDGFGAIRILTPDGLVPLDIPLGNLGWGNVVNPAIAEFRTYRPGGLDDGAEHTVNAWLEIWEAIEAYTPVTTLFVDSLPKISSAWYREPVSISFKATDNFTNQPDYGEPFTTYYSINGSKPILYEGPFTLPSDTFPAEGVIQISYYSVDAFGNEEQAKQATIKIDTRAPELDAWLDKTEYTRVEPFVVHFEGSDPMPGSGLESFTIKLDGKVVPGGLMQNPQPGAYDKPVDLLWVGLGNHTVTVTARDVAGWETEKSLEFSLYATIESLQGTVNRLCQEKYITKAGTCKELSAKLKAALAALDRGNNKTAVNVLKAFQNAVKAQKNKAIRVPAANLLLADSKYVIDQLSQ